MVYHKQTLPTALDNGYYKYSGWGETSNRPDYQELWNPYRLRQLQAQITEILEGVEPSGRPIVVTLDVIGNVLSSVYETNRPEVGDIYSRFIQTEGAGTRNDIAECVDRTIEIITTQIRNEYETIACNQKLTVWNSLYGDFNTQGLRQHPPIKLRKKRPTPMLFNMHY